MPNLWGASLVSRDVAVVRTWHERSAKGDRAGIAENGGAIQMVDGWRILMNRERSKCRGTRDQ